MRIGRSGYSARAAVANLLEAGQRVYALTHLVDDHDVRCERGDLRGHRLAPVERGDHAHARGVAGGETHPRDVRGLVGDQHQRSHPAQYPSPERRRKGGLPTW